MNTKITAWEAASEVIRTLVKKTKPGISTLDLSEIAETKILELGVESLNKNYQPKKATVPFPSVVCIGINDVICHGIPSKEEILKDGDLVSYDLGVRTNGLAGDCAITVPVGNISDRDARLLRYAKQALYEGVEIIKPGAKLGDISSTIGYYARKMGFVVNRQFAGHFIGKEMHEPPTILHVYVPNVPQNDLELLEGWTLCLEPILSYNDDWGKPDKNGWTWRTKDGRKSAIFEHQIRVTHTGYEILTKHFTK
jgi:methionyl aminopeptidase